MAALTRILRGAALPLLGVLALGSAGCVNPFTPATPESPIGNSVVEDYSTPDKLLSTLIAGMNDKGPSGRLAWTNAMADSTDANTRAFYAFHDPLVLSAWTLSSPTPPPDVWDLDLERQFYDKFVARYSGDYQMLFGPDNDSPSDEPGTDTWLLHRRYFIYSVETNGQQATIAQGYVDLYLVKYDGRWWVVRWQDRLDPTVGVDPTDQTSYTLGYRRLESLSS